MLLYVLYRIGYAVANHLPLRVAYRLACRIADMHYSISRVDRNAVLSNLKIICGQCGDKKMNFMAKEVFRNFAKYLVDFFRFLKIDEEYMRKYIKIEGFENIDKGLLSGKGVIALSAHLGNWELGGLVLSLKRHPMKAIVLTHQNKLINDFFTAQRSIGNMRPVEIGMSLRGCYNVLADNGLLALLGDRDFSNNGINVKFFGKDMPIPKGPAVFSYRLGACIVPCFMVREEDDSFKFTFEPPIYPDKTKDEASSVKDLAEKYSSIIERYVRMYPTQWYMFQEAWR